MSTSRAHVEDTYEAQNDERLDDLHNKLRTLRGVSSFDIIFRVSGPRYNHGLYQVTTDIYDDVERQNSALDRAVSIVFTQSCITSEQCVIA